MATWIYAYGKNEIIPQTVGNDAACLALLNTIEVDELQVLDSMKGAGENKPGSVRKYYESERATFQRGIDKQSDEEYKQYLAQRRMPFIEKSKLIDYWIEQGEKEAEEKASRFKDVYSRIKNKQLKGEWLKEGDGFYRHNLAYFEQWDGIKMHLENDLIWASGPMAVFSRHAQFQKGIPEETRNYYHRLFSQIMRLFKSPFILYAHEWSAIHNDGEANYNYQVLQKQIKNAGPSSSSIHDMEDFYYQDL